MVTISNISGMDVIKNNDMLKLIIGDRVEESSLYKRIQEVLEVLEENYGKDGRGGSVYLIESLVDMEHGEYEINQILVPYNLGFDEYETEEIIFSNDMVKCYMRIYIMTEFHLILVYMKGGADDEIL